jgi:hypothetical protein
VGGQWQRSHSPNRVPSVASARPIASAMAAPAQRGSESVPGLDQAAGGIDQMRVGVGDGCGGQLAGLGTRYPMAPV